MIYTRCESRGMNQRERTVDRRASDSNRLIINGSILCVSVSLPLLHARLSVCAVWRDTYLALNFLSIRRSLPSRLLTNTRFLQQRRAVHLQTAESTHSYRGTVHSGSLRLVPCRSEPTRSRRNGPAHNIPRRHCATPSDA